MKTLYLFVEGPSDIIFFNSPQVRQLLLTKGYDFVECHEYENLSKVSVKGFINTIANCNVFEYIFTADKDELECITKALNKNKKEFSIRDEHKIVIVNCEIESWYLAGINDFIKTNYSLTIPTNTQGVNKEEFDKSYVPTKLDKFSFMTEIAEGYDMTLAKSRNKSFKYFIDRMDDKILNQYYGT